MGKAPKHPNHQWLVLLDTGRTVGPYSTDGVIRLISEGALDERCRIKSVGSGSWEPITKFPVFFDAILESMKKTPEERASAAENLISETVVAPMNPSDVTQERIISGPSPDSITQDPRLREAQIEVPKAKKPASRKSSGKSQVVDLANLTNLALKQRASASRIPIFLVLVAGVLIGLAYFLDRQPSRDQIRLIVPRLDLQPKKMSEKAIDAEFRRARNYFWIDTVEGFLQAQTLLVSLVEAAPQYLPARGYLCLVYRELWPYIQQTKSDTEAINIVAKSTKVLDPAGANGAYCEIARMLTQGKMTEVRGMVDYLLERADSERQAQLDMQGSQETLAYRFSTDPVIMSIRAELLSGLRDDVLARSDPFQAALYVENIQKYTPQWVKMYYLQAKFLLQAGQPQKAAHAFEVTLKANPNHKPALIEYGIMNYMQFRQTDKALNYITGAINSRGITTRQLEARARYTLARIYSERRDFSQALEEAQKAYTLNPSDNQVKSLVLELGGSVKVKSSNMNNSLVFEGDQHAREGDCMVAQAMFKAAFEADPKNGLAAMKAAKCLKSLNRPLEGISWLKKAIRADPKLTTAYLLLADYYSERYDFRQAESVLNDASAKFPSQYEILRGYGLVAFRQNLLRASIGFLNRALRGYENDIETLVLLAKTHLQLGRSLNDSESLQKSLSYAARALELDRANVDAHVVYAQALAPFKGLDSAINYLSELKTQFSRNIEYPLAIAELYRISERYRQAVDHYRAVIDWRPETKDAHLGLAHCLYMNGDITAALKSYYDAAYYDPSDPEPFVRIANIYIESGKFAEAVGPLKKALDANEFKPMVRYYLGKAYLGLNEYKQALTWAKEEISHNPKIADGYILAAQIYAQLESFKDCAEQYQTAVGLRDIKKHKAELYVSMARCQRQSGNLDGAQGSLDIAVTLESGNANIYREQGALFEARGDRASAAAAYNKYLTLHPNAKDKHEIERRISSMGE